MRRRTTRTLRYAVLAAGVALMGTGTASAAQPVEPGELNWPVPDGTGGNEAENPATVCNNEVAAGPLLVGHPCFDSSQFAPDDIDEGVRPAPELPGSGGGGVQPRSAVHRAPAQQAPPEGSSEFGRGQDINEPVVVNDLGHLPEVSSVPAPGSGAAPALATLDTASVGLAP